MNATERACKLAALNKLFQGNDKPARALKPDAPEVMAYLNSLSNEHLEALHLLQRAEGEGRVLSHEETEFKRFFNDFEVPMIPVPTSLKFMP